MLIADPIYARGQISRNFVEERVNSDYWQKTVEFKKKSQARTAEKPINPTQSTVAVTFFIDPIQARL